MNDETVDILRGHGKTGLSLGVISKHSRAFSQGQDTELEYLLEVVNFQLYLGVCLILSLIFIYFFFFLLFLERG